MNKAIAALIVAAALPACGAKEVNDNTVQIMSSGSADADYLVLFLNRRTILYDGDLPADRLRVTGSRLKIMGCREPHLVRERAEEQDGTWPLGGKRIVYLSDWRCG